MNTDVTTAAGSCNVCYSSTGVNDNIVARSY